MAEKIHAKVMINTIGLPPEMEKEEIQRVKIALLKELMTRYPSDEYQEIAFHIEGLPLEVVDEKARQYQREDGEWYWKGERVRSEQVFEMVKKGLVEAHLTAWIEKREDAKEFERWLIFLK